MMKKVFIYVRRSSDISIEKQIEEIQKICNKEGFVVEGIYKDNQSIYTDGKNKEYSKMLNDIEKRNHSEKQINIIYVYTISKLVKNIEKLNDIKDFISNNDIQILSLKESYQEGLKGKQSLIDDLNEIISSKK